jgi:hypothetical protein
MAFPSLYPQRLVGKIGKLMVSNVGEGMVSTICQNRIILALSADTV